MRQHADSPDMHVPPLSLPGTLPSPTWRLGDDPKAGLGSERLREDALLACCCAICCKHHAAESMSVRGCSALPQTCAAALTQLPHRPAADRAAAHHMVRLEAAEAGLAVLRDAARRADVDWADLEGHG